MQSPIGIRKSDASREMAVAASITHELRQPLTSILLTAQAAVRMIDSHAPIDMLELRGLLLQIIDLDKRAGVLVQQIRLGG